MIKILIVGNSYGNNKIIDHIVDLERPNFIVHSGNHFNTKEFMNQNFDFYVCGDEDKQVLPVTRDFEINNFTFHLEYGNLLNSVPKKEINNFILEMAQKCNKDVFIFGYGKNPIIKNEHDLFIINPGSLNKHFTNTYILTTIMNDSISISLKTLEK